MTARVTTMTLCDFAQVRDSLLFVSSGGVSRVVSNSFPARLHLYLATVVHISPDQVHRPHRMSVKFKYPDVVATIGAVEVNIQLNQVRGVYPGEGVNVPQAIDLSQIPFPQPGQVDVQVSIDDQMAGDLTFWLLAASPQQPN
jgi:hypothetical protein